MAVLIYALNLKTDARKGACTKRSLPVTFTNMWRSLVPPACESWRFVGMSNSGGTHALGTIEGLGTRYSDRNMKRSESTRTAWAFLNSCKALLLQGNLLNRSFILAVSSTQKVRRVCPLFLLDLCDGAQNLELELDILNISLTLVLSGIFHLIFKRGDTRIGKRFGCFMHMT